MTLDLLSVLVVSSVVVNVSGIVFIVETLLRRDDGAGRVWALGFLAAMLTTLAYVLWARSGVDLWALAAGNATFVTATGCMWLGCRRFNGRRIRRDGLLVAVGAGGAAVAVVVDGLPAGDWAGAVWMFVALTVLSSAAAVECLRGMLGGTRSAWVLAVVFGLQCGFYVGRTVVFLLAGPESALFRYAFGSIALSFGTVILTVVAVVILSVLRATRVPLFDPTGATLSDIARDGIVAEGVFAGMWSALCVRARQQGATVALVAVRIDDLAQMTTAFGGDVTGLVVDDWRRGVAASAPAGAILGEDSRAGLLVGCVVDDARGARSAATAVYRGVFDRLGAATHGIIPVVGVGVADSTIVGHDPHALIVAARDAALTAATRVDAAVVSVESREATQA
ncbi:hypothetical protein [Microbacterium sp. NPDC077184]|uniref:hypothetical protein n=1 Tax=Microbacterium sp. NPDC077184 TaxID=3154764 RepID=UPI00341757EA